MKEENNVERAAPERTQDDEMLRSEDHSDFPTELLHLLNRWNRENGSNTPDFILRDYLCACLKTFNATVNRREEWYGRRGQV